MAAATRPNLAEPRRLATQTPARYVWSPSQTPCLALGPRVPTFRAPLISSTVARDHTRPASGATGNWREHHSPDARSAGVPGYRPWATLTGFCNQDVCTVASTQAKLCATLFTQALSRTLTVLASNNTHCPPNARISQRPQPTNGTHHNARITPARGVTVRPTLALRNCASIRSFSATPPPPPSVARTRRCLAATAHAGHHQPAGQRTVARHGRDSTDKTRHEVVEALPTLQAEALILVGAWRGGGTVVKL